MSIGVIIIVIILLVVIIIKRKSQSNESKTTNEYEFNVYDDINETEGEYSEYIYDKTEEYETNNNEITNYNRYENKRPTLPSDPYYLTLNENKESQTLHYLAMT